MPGRRPPLPARFRDRARRPGPGDDTRGRPARGRSHCGTSASRMPGCRRSPRDTGCRVRCCRWPTGCCRTSPPTCHPRPPCGPADHALSYRPIGQLVDAVRACASVEGSVGVIVPDARAADVQRTLDRAGLGAAALADDTDARGHRRSAASAKGLEFDSVVLLEPAAIVAGEPERPIGLRRLYVSLTRAVSRLVVVHDEPLPAELAG